MSRSSGRGSASLRVGTNRVRLERLEPRHLLSASPTELLSGGEGDAAVEAAGAYPENPTVFPRQVEDLNRGLVALRTGGGTAYLSWRLFGDDPEDIAFNVYRDGRGGGTKLNAQPITGTTDFIDNNFSGSSFYYIRPVVDGVEQEASESYYLDGSAPAQKHLDIPLVIPPGGVTPDGVEYSYSANDASVGDLDGDGQYEIILKWDPSNSKDNSQSGYTGNVYVDAYTLEGDLLWRIDLGRNIRAGAHYTQMLVYDFDGDGRSEVVLKTAPGTIDGQGDPVLASRGASVDDDYRNSGGYILDGPEYLTVFDGLTGAELTSIPFPMERISASTWGDGYGNRADRFLAGVAYLDGTRPSIVWARGYYGPRSGFSARNEVVAYDYRDGQLTERWYFAASTEGPYEEYIGQGSNALAVGDVDGDGYDEIIHGASALDHDGSPLYSTGLGHGDALHLSDMDPTRPGLEVFMVHESPGAYQSDGRDAGGGLRDAATGELLFQIPSNNDVGRGVAADIDPNRLGYEFWATTNEGTRYIYNVDGTALYQTPGNMFYNFAVWWDGDLSRELLDGTTIAEWNNPGRSNLVWYGANGLNNNSGLSSNNGSKSTPAFAGDLIGDWREEVIWRRSDSSALEVWVTTTPAQNRLPTLMHDTHYRSSVAGQNVAYNQPSHPSYFIGEGMADPPRVPLFRAGGLEGDYNADGSVDTADYVVWRNTRGTDNPAADGDHNGLVDDADLQVWKDNYGRTTADLATFTTTVSALLAAELEGTGAGTASATATPLAPALATEPTGDEPSATLSGAASTPVDDNDDLLLLSVTTSSEPAAEAVEAPAADDGAPATDEAFARWGVSRGVIRSRWGL